jgi:rod shape determining protein RodA
LAHDTKGSLSWIDLGGGVKLQPAEFAKFTTALCVAKLIDGYKMDLSKWPKLLMAALVFVIPMGLIIMQKETGSALVYLAFFLMCYREGMSGSVLFAGVAAVTYFVVGARYAELPFWGVLQTSTGQFMVLSLIHVFTSLLLWVYGEFRSDSFRLFSSGLLVIVCAMLFSRYVVPFNASWIVLLVLVADIVYLILLSFKDQILRYFYIALFTLISTGFYYSVDYVLSDVLRPHQQTRVKVLLGLEDDPRGAGYNVIQAQIAIGSGGLRGKGFLRGTQTKLKYVPEQDTDFIFCTVGEEEGFLGCSAVLLLFLALILRLIVLAEHQYYTFGRVYGYCVLSIFLFHLFINVGMVLGLTPVIGIPLPFFSYGGSSLWGFTLLLFIFLRMDAGRRRSEHK